MPAKLYENDSFEVQYMLEHNQFLKLIPRTKPNNETYKHWFCKIVGQAILWERFNCKYIGMEINSMYHMDKNVGICYNSKKKATGRQYWMEKKGVVSKEKIDVVGITRKLDKIVGIESKANVEDFKNGYCCACDYTYIICPKDVIDVELIPKGIGLIYVDIENFKYIPNQMLIGVSVVKRATYRRDTRWNIEYSNNAGVRKKFPTVVDYYNDWVENIYDKIARRNSIRSVFDSRYIPTYRVER